jgi:hypothetical protein
MMKCRDVATLVSSGQVGDQPFSRRMGVWFHLMMCQHCRRFWRQVRVLDKAVRSMADGLKGEKPADLERRTMDRLRGGRG